MTSLVVDGIVTTLGVSPDSVTVVSTASDTSQTVLVLEVAFADDAAASDALSTLESIQFEPQLGAVEVVADSRQISGDSSGSWNAFSLSYVIIGAAAVFLICFFVGICKCKEYLCFEPKAPVSSSFDPVEHSAVQMKVINPRKSITTEVLPARQSAPKAAARIPPAVGANAAAKAGTSTATRAVTAPKAAVKIVSPGASAAGTAAAPSISQTTGAKAAAKQVAPGVSTTQTGPKAAAKIAAPGASGAKSAGAKAVAKVVAKTPPVPAKAPALPPNWESAVDPDSKETYYFNRVTQVTTWDRPTK